MSQVILVFVTVLAKGGRSKQYLTNFGILGCFFDGIRSCLMVKSTPFLGEI